VFRNPSRSEWGTQPTWVINLHDRAQTNHYTGPRGPFYEPTSRFFAESLGAAAEIWLEDPHSREMTAVANQYRIVMHDQRLTIERVSLKAQSDQAMLAITLATGMANPPSADVALLSTDFNGRRQRSISAVTACSSHLPVSLPQQSFEAIVFDRESGQWLDRFHDGGFGHASLLTPTRSSSSTKYEQLLHDLDRGECESVEFKLFLDPDRRDNKSYELLKEVTAFANATGGILYIGVNDDGEVVGVVGELYKRAKKNSSRSLSELRDEYADKIRKTVNEGITPTPKVLVEWVEHAGLHVLAVETQAIDDAPHHVVEDGQHWMRRGGTCRRGLPERFIQRRGGSQSFDQRGG
jgi:hypothetical protein